MKKLIISIVFGISISCFGQQVIDSLITPAADNDTMICIPGLNEEVVFVDYSDLDGDVYICVGPDAGDSKPTFYLFGSADSILCDYSAPRMIEGSAVRRKSFLIDYDWDETCFRIWNVDASADSTVYIYTYEFVP